MVVLRVDQCIFFLAKSRSKIQEIQMLQSYFLQFLDEVDCAPNRLAVLHRATTETHRTEHIHILGRQSSQSTFYCGDGTQKTPIWREEILQKITYKSSAKIQTRDLVAVRPLIYWSPTWCSTKPFLHIFHICSCYSQCEICASDCDYCNKTIWFICIIKSFLELRPHTG